MDLRAGERVLDRLEEEASRLSGLGNLRAQLDTAMRELEERATTLQGASTSMLSATQEADQRQQEALAHLRQSIEALQRDFVALRGSVDDQLSKNGNAIRTGLVEIHKQVQELALQIDRGVKAELARSAGELRTDLNTAFGTLGRQLDLSAREQHQALQAGLSEVGSAVDRATRTLSHQLRTAAIAIGTISVVGFAILIWLMTRA